MIGTLAEFCAKKGFKSSQTTLTLETLMPARRKRWWCVLVSSHLQTPYIRPLPELPVPPVIGDVMPFCPAWRDDEVHVLTLDLHEARKFDRCGGLHAQILSVKGQCPTALHGWACQLTSCPCGCRKSPMSEQRLTSKGLFGALVPIGGSFAESPDLPRVRHLHPYEIAVFHGCLLNMDWQPLRLAIVGLGQMATPVQSCWIIGHVMHANPEFESIHTPEQHLWNHFQHFFRSYQDTQPVLFAHSQVQQFVDRIRTVLKVGHIANEIVPWPKVHGCAQDSNSQRSRREDSEDYKQPADQTPELEVGVGQVVVNASDSRECGPLPIMPDRFFMHVSEPTPTKSKVVL